MATTVSVKEHFNHMTAQEQIEMKRVMRAILADNVALRASIVGITAKLDADIGVNDVNYASLHDPAALELVS